MTIERLLVILEDRIQEHESEEEHNAHSKGYADACRWILEVLEESFLRGDLPEVSDDEEDTW